MSRFIVLIRPTKGLGLNINELLHYKDLLWFLVIRGIKAKYAQSVLGIGWAIIQPLLTTVIFTVVFGNLAKIESQGVPYHIFSLTGIIPWTYFANSVNEATSSLLSSSNLITKVYFPRIVLPLSAVLSKLLDFFIAFFIMIIILMIHGYYNISLGLIMFPFILTILVVTSLGLGMWLSALAVQYRDVRYAMGFVIQLLIYLSPVLYPTSKVPQHLQFLYSLNPLVCVVETFRASFLLHQSISWNFVINGSLVALVIFISGLIFFIRCEKKFADVI